MADGALKNAQDTAMHVVGAILGGWAGAELSDVNAIPQLRNLLGKPISDFVLQASGAAVGLLAADRVVGGETDHTARKGIFTVVLAGIGAALGGKYIDPMELGNTVYDLGAEIGTFLGGLVGITQDSRIADMASRVASKVTSPLRD